MIRKFVAFDIETAQAAQEGQYNLGITCAASITSDGDVQRWHGAEAFGHIDNVMEPDYVIDFARYLLDLNLAGYDIVTWNGLGFDFRVMACEVKCLEWYDNIREIAMHHIDPAFQMLCEKGFMVGLEAAARGMQLQGKTEGMNGLKAVEMWALGREEQDKVLGYVEQDARATADVYRAIVEYNKLRWISRSGKPNAWYPVFNIDGDGTRRMLTVTEAIATPEPDTSWMTSPMPRSRFAEWAAEG